MKTMRDIVRDYISSYEDCRINNDVRECNCFGEMPCLYGPYFDCLFSLSNDNDTIEESEHYKVVYCTGVDLSVSKECDEVKEKTCNCKGCKKC